MLRSSLLAVCALVLAAVASAQTPQALTAEKMPTAVRHAGIYHLETGTWTRTGGEVANFGPDICYCNNAPSSYFSSAGGAGGFAPLSENFDEGGLPGTTNATPFPNPPTRDECKVNCIQITYCDMGTPGSSGWRLNFYNSYTPCTLDAMPDSTVVATGLPAAGGCWMVGIDLVGAEICLPADGGSDAPGWDNDPMLDSFGWSYTYAGSDGSMPAGFLLAGNPSVTDPTYISGGLPMDASGTSYGTTNCPGLGTGYITQDFWWLEDPAGVSSNCYFFGGYSNNNGSCAGPSNPLASWCFCLLGEPAPCPIDNSFGSIYCMSNSNSTGMNTGISLTGTPFAIDDTVSINAFDMPDNSFGFFIVSETQGFVANPNGSQGNLCVLGQIGRFVGPGQIMNSGTIGGFSLATSAGLWSLTAVPTPMGPRVSTMGTTDNFQLWHRDVGGNSNFSDAVTHTWL